jgi:hypothetical protein
VANPVMTRGMRLRQNNPLQDPLAAGHVVNDPPGENPAAANAAGPRPLCRGWNPPAANPRAENVNGGRRTLNRGAVVCGQAAGGAAARGRAAGGAAAQGHGAGRNPGGGGDGGDSDSDGHSTGDAEKDDPEDGNGAGAEGEQSHSSKVSRRLNISGNASKIACFLRIGCEECSQGVRPTLPQPKPFRGASSEPVEQWYETWILYMQSTSTKEHEYGRYLPPFVEPSVQ